MHSEEAAPTPLAPVDLINWQMIPPGITIVSPVTHAGRSHISFALHGQGVLPWCVNPTQVSPATNMFIDGTKFFALFETPSALVVGDELSLFKGIAECLKFLKLKGLALEALGPLTFCQGEDGQECRLFRLRK